MKLTKRDFGLLALVIYFTFIGGTFYSQLTFTLRVFNQIVVTLILAGWLLGRVRRKEGLPATRLDLALGLYLLVNIISAWLGLSPRLSFERLWFTLTHILAFYLLVDLIRRGWANKLTWAFFMASAVVCIVAFTEIAAWYFGSALFANFAQGWWEIGGWRNPIPPLIYRLAITLNGPTALAAYLALFIPVALGLILTLSARNENRRALQIWLVMAFVVQIFTFARAGLLALVTSLSLLAAGWLLTRKSRSFDILSRWRAFKPLSQISILAGSLLLAGGVFFWLQRLLARGTSSANFRFMLWDTALNIFQSQWLTGVGPGNFGRALLRYNDPSLPRLQISTAHNIYLNTAAELGGLGLIAGGLLILSLGWAWWQRWRQIPASDTNHRLRLIVVGAALTGLAVQTLVDTYLATPNMLVMLVLVAYVVADLPPFRWSWPKQTAAYVGLGLLAIYGVGFFWIAGADNHYRRSFRYERSRNLEAALDQAMLAQQQDPTFPLYTLRTGMLKARLAHQMDEPSLVTSAIVDYQTVLQQESIWGRDSANLAALLWGQGRRSEAIETLQKTVAAEANAMYWLNLGYYYEQEEQRSEAEAAYGRALWLDSNLAGSGFWTATPARSERWPSIVQAAIDFAVLNDPLGQARFRMSLAQTQEDFETVERLLKSLPAHVGGNTERLATLELHLHRNQADQAQTLLPTYPERAEDYLWLGRVQLQMDEIASAETALKTAIFMGEPRANYYLGQVYEAQGKMSAAEDAYRRGFIPRYSSENVEVTIYGRLSGNDFAPQLLRLGLSPSRAAPWLALARLYEEQGRFDEAEQVYRLLLSEDPFFTVAQERLAELSVADKN